ncbi:MAG: cysteine--tRNA ligase [Rhodospirillales bacterium]|nr:MAG: cysteine--tRNA ligase [Rhodospirillales bacterium]
MTGLKLHNTLSRSKETFVPLDPAHVRLYVCGPTVYDRAHIGNARPVIVFDVLVRLLRTLYPRVTYVRNITDVDDKINAKAKASNKLIAEITAETTRLFHEDMKALGALPPDIEPRATAHIPQMIGMIENLIEQGHAYEAEGHVLFSVPSMADYGKLSGRSRDEMIAGARVEVAPYKKDPADFVLWKPSTDDLPGWESPWGRGRPGWHIECSAMSREYLGDTFDIHGGGQDLIFPHHENEIAQSECCNQAPFARFWLHNGFLKVEGEKMSKSIGNILSVRELLGEAPGEAIRFAVLSAHYRQPLDWTDEGLKAAKTALDRLYRALEAAPCARQAVEAPLSVRAALMDDLNTPLAISHLHELAGALNKAGTDQEKQRIAGELKAAGALLGLLSADPQQWKTGSGEAGSITGQGGDQDIEALIALRAEAKKSRNFKEADRIRDELKTKGVLLEDGPGGTTWRRA